MCFLFLANGRLAKAAKATVQQRTPPEPPTSTTTTTATATVTATTSTTSTLSQVEMKELEKRAFRAVMKDDKAALSTLLEQGVGVNCRNAGTHTLLEMAVERHRWVCVCEVKR